MQHRKLQDGVSVYELEDSVTLEVRTRAPMKWILYDRETGEQYIGSTPKPGELHWKRIPEGSEYVVAKRT